MSASVTVERALEAVSLKLDKVLAEQGDTRAEVRELREAQAALTAGLVQLGNQVDTLNGSIVALDEAVNAEDPEGQERAKQLAGALRRIGETMKQLSEETARVVTVMNGLPRAVSDAALDGVRLALGDALDVKS
jgi:predicted  nucleic acid-binding Zn-ribbon protein